jgi:hypothetical protein
MNFLGLPNSYFYDLWNRYEIDNYFSEEENKER